MAKKNGVELAKAYVQIIPSMEGAQGMIEQAVGQALSHMPDIGSQAGASLGSALSSAFSKATEFLGDSIVTGMGFDSAMSQVAATMGKTVGEIKELRYYAKEMGATTAFSATQSAEALNFMALAGYDAQTSMKMLPNVMDLAAAGGMELARASDMITDSQTALGLSIEDTEKLVDQMAKTASTTNTSVSQLGDAVLTLGSTAKNLSGGTAELNQVLGIMADNGIKAGEAGTHLRNIMLAMQPTTKDAIEAFDKLNFSAYDSEGNLREMSDIFGELSEKTAAMTKEERQNIIGKIFNKTDLAAVNALLDTNAGRWEEVAGAIEEADGAAKAMADTQLDNLEGDITLMKSALEGLQIAISDEITPDLRELVQTATKGLEWATEHIHTVIGVVEALGVAVAAMKLPAVITAAKKAMTAFNAVCAANPLGAVLAAAVSTALLLKGAIDDATDALNEIPDAFEGLDEDDIEFVKKTAEYTDDLTDALNRQAEAEMRYQNAKEQRSALEEQLAKAIEEYDEINSKSVTTEQERLRAMELQDEIIPGLTSDIGHMNAAVGELGAAYISASENVRELESSFDMTTAGMAGMTAASEASTAAAEEMAVKQEELAERVKQSMKDALTVNIELNGKTAELSRSTAEQMGNIIDSYDEMYAHQRQAIESSFDLFDGFTADTSLTFDTLMKNLKDTSFYMNDWATAIEQLGEKGVSKGLLDELKSMGADSWQIVYAMNHATQEQLDEYSKLWDSTQGQITSTTDRMMAEEKQKVEAELSDLAGIPDAKLDEIRTAFDKAGFEGVKSYGDAISAHFDKAEKAVDELSEAAVAELSARADDFIPVGENITGGVANGILDEKALSEVDNAIDVMAQRAIERAKKDFDERSPSHIFDGIGEYLPVGLADGVVRKTEEAEKAVSYMAETVIGAAKDRLSGADTSFDINARALDYAARVSAPGRTAEPVSTEPPAQPLTLQIVTPDRRTVAEWLFPDINALLGRITALQTGGFAT